MPPPEDKGEGRPPRQGPAPHANETPSPTRSTRPSVCRDCAAAAEAAPLTRAEVTRWLELDRQSYEQGWRDGYRWGWTAGVDVGRGQTHDELKQQWAGAARQIQRVTRPEKPTEAWQWLTSWRARHGEYRGGPVDYWTGRPASKHAGAA